MWNLIQILLIIILLMGIILLSKPLYVQLGRPKIHFTRKWERNLLYSIWGILGAIAIIAIVAVGMELWQDARPQSPPPIKQGAEYEWEGLGNP